MKFRIETNEFDSSTLVPKAGNLVFDNGQEIITEQLIDDIKDNAKKEQYNFLSFKYNKEINLKEPDFVGITYELSANIEDVFYKLKPFTGKFKIRKIVDSDWDQIYKLLNFASNTRFSNDKKLDREKVKNHKTLIFKHLVKNFPDYSLAALGQNNEIVGVHFLRILNSSKVYLQEILIKPEYRIGFVSLQLVKENIDRIYKDKISRDIYTKIYADNSQSLKFFHKIGFTKLLSKEYHYHLWIS